MTLRCKPLFSVIIVAYNMPREIPRTVASFLPGFQMDMEPDDIEILVMENGSARPVPPEVRDGWPGTVRYVPLDNAHASPAAALNQGIAMASAPWVCPVIDGARMVTPGIFSYATQLIKLHHSPVIATVGFHLGHEPQQLSVERGYNQKEEDDLLRSINWPDEPYRLFEIACLGESAKGAWLSPIAESNALVLKKSFCEDIGGFDESFDLPGGGLINLDFFERAISHPDSLYYLLVGEGSFHQFHDGVTTSRSVAHASLEDEARTTWELYAAQYEHIRGRAYRLPTVLPTLYGKLNPSAQHQTVQAALSLGSIS